MRVYDREAGTACLAIGLVLVTALPALAWTTPIWLSSAPSGSEPSVPRIIDGSDGKLHAVYRSKPEWRIYYRERLANGQWQPIQTLSSVFSDRPDIVEDTAGRLHVVYAGHGVSTQLDLYHAIRQNGNWTTANITNNAQSNDEPRMGVDALGRVHLVYTQTDNDADHSGKIRHRVWNGSWSADADLGNVADAYYHRPDISVDPAGNAHVVWVDNSSNHTVKYARSNGTSWPSPIAPIDIGGGTGTFVAYPKIAAPTNQGIVAVWHDGNIRYAASSNGGASWSGAGTITAGHYPSLDAGAGGNAHLVCERQPDGKALLYSKWNGANWSAVETIAPGSNLWKGWPDLTVDAAGAIHVVCDDTVSQDQHQITYSSSAPDTYPPGPVSNLTAAGSNTIAHLAWTHPADQDFAGVLIRVRTDHFPQGPADGQIACQVTGSPGATANCDSAGLVNGQTYYFSAFAYDAVGNYAAPAQATTVPFGPADHDRDGDVDQSDFGHFQSCMSGASVPQHEPLCQDALLDTDSDVDSADLAVFLNCMSGPGNPAQSNCAG